MGKIQGFLWCEPPFVGFLLVSRTGEDPPLHLVCGFKDASVCTFRTSPCILAKRTHVEHMWACCQYTRRRPERTHGGVWDLHTGVFSACQAAPHNTHQHAQHTQHTHNTHKHTPHTTHNAQHTPHTTHNTHTHTNTHQHTPTHTNTHTQRHSTTHHNNTQNAHSTHALNTYTPTNTPINTPANTQDTTHNNTTLTHHTNPPTHTTPHAPRTTDNDLASVIPGKKRESVTTVIFVRS